MRVLVVEDNEDDLVLIREYLSRVQGEAIHVGHATDLGACIASLAMERHDCVLLDLGLPDSQGLSTLTRARQESPDLPFVVLTGNEDRELGLKAVRCGAQDYLAKGDLNPALLEKTIRYAIARQKSQGEREVLMEQVKASMTRFRTLVEFSLDGIVIANQAGRVRFVNPSAKRMLGTEDEKLIKEHVSRPGLVADGTTPVRTACPGLSPGAMELRTARIEWAGEPALLIWLRAVQS